MAGFRYLPASKPMRLEQWLTRAEPLAGLNNRLAALPGAG